MFPRSRRSCSIFLARPERWSRTVRPLLWMNTTVAVPGFTDNVLVDLQLPVHFRLQCRGDEVFPCARCGRYPDLCDVQRHRFLSRSPTKLSRWPRCPGTAKPTSACPVSVWKEMMEMHFPNTAWLCLQRDVFEQLYEYKVRHGIPTWEQAIRRALAAEIPEEVKA